MFLKFNIASEKLKIFLILLVLLFIFNSESSFGVGIGSSQIIKYIDMLPEASYSFNYFVSPTRSYPFNYRVYLEGDETLLKFFSVSQSFFSNLTGRGYFNVNVAFPQELPPIDPGLYTIWVTVKEEPIGGGGISAISAARMPINVRVLYADAYIKASIAVPNGNVGDLLSVNLKLENWGRQRTTCYGSVKILDGSHTVIKALPFEDVLVEAASSENVPLVLDTTGFLQGEYTAIAEVYWEGKGSTTASTTFLIGNLDLNIKSYTEELKAGEINPFEIVVESLWNNPMEDVYAEIKLESPDGKQFSTKTPTYTLDPWKELTLKGYVDLTEATTGRYKGKVIVHFDGKSKEKNIKVDVTSKEVVEAPAPAPTVLGLSTGVFIGLLVAIIALIALNVFVVLYFIRREKSKKPKRSRRRK